MKYTKKGSANISKEEKMIILLFSLLNSVPSTLDIFQYI